jgi:hypothetical protein
MKTVFAVVLFAFVFCQSAFAGILELKGLSRDAEGISIRVSSGGCTDKTTIVAVQLEKFPVQVRFERIEEDVCEAHMPDGVLLKYSYSELGLSPDAKIVVLNPVVNR